MKPAAESISWKYVERRRANATGLPRTVPRPAIRPIFVRSARSVCCPGGVWSAGVGVHWLVRSSTSIGRHAPRKR